jgi:hypothetical protein
VAIGASVIELILAVGVSAQKLGGATGDDDIAPWRVILILALCLLLAVGGAFALRWKMQRSGAPLSFGQHRRMLLIERVRLSHQVDLCLVRCDGREFMITTSPRDTRFGPEVAPGSSAVDG